MSIPKTCIDAAGRHPEDFLHNAEARARRVILALAGDLPEEAVKAAREAYWVTWNSASNGAEIDAAMDDAISVFLKHVAGETP